MFVFFTTPQYEYVTGVKNASYNKFTPNAEHVLYRDLWH